MKALLKCFVAFLCLNFAFPSNGNAQIIIQDVIIFKVKKESKGILYNEGFTKDRDKSFDTNRDVKNNNEITSYMVRDKKGRIVKDGVISSPKQIASILSAFPKDRYRVEFNRRTQ